MTDPEDKKKRALIVSYLSPSASAIGAVRIRKFIKYLPEFGWEPVLLTVDETGGQKEENKGIIRESNSIRRFLHRLYRRIAMLSRFFYHQSGLSFIIGVPWGWYLPALKKGRRILHESPVDIIFSSLKPVVPVFVASRLQRQTGIPWITEFRDLWSLCPYTGRIWPLCLFEKWLEKRVIRNTQMIVTISKNLADTLEKLHSKKVMVISNGFDEDDYTEGTPLTEKFTITYTGSIYPGKRDPSRLFQAISKMVRERAVTPDTIEVRFFGDNVIESISPLVKRYGLEEFVKIFNKVPYEESIRRQQESTVLLQLSWNDPRDAGTTTGKFFEYLGAGRPILALAFKSGAIGSLLQETGCGIVANETGEIKNILAKWLEEFYNSDGITSNYAPNLDAIRSYTRREQARKLAAVFGRVAALKR